MRTHSSFSSAPLVLAAIAALPGCGFTSGNDGRADFSYDSGTGCLFGCDTSKPLMAGTTETLTVSGLTGAASLASSAPGVVRFSSTTTQYECNAQTPDSASSTASSADAACPKGSTKSAYMTVTLNALQPGHATLDVRNPDGTLFDALDVDVEAAASLQVVDAHGVPVSAVTVARGAIEDLSVLAMDAQGRRMQASSGFSYEVADAGVADTQQHDFTLVSPVIPVHGDASGATRITVTAGQATASVAVTVP